MYTSVEAAVIGRPRPTSARAFRDRAVIRLARPTCDGVVFTVEYDGGRAEFKQLAANDRYYVRGVTQPFRDEFEAAMVAARRAGLLD